MLLLFILLVGAQTSHLAVGSFSICGSCGFCLFLLTVVNSSEPLVICYQLIVKLGQRRSK